MSTAAILLRNETIKITRRLAFWVTLVGFSVLCSLQATGTYYSATRVRNSNLGLPNWWARVLEEPIMMAAVFGSAILVLLIASEFSWRTARQNVVDGLSRDQWFAGKVLNLPLVLLPMMLAGGIIVAIFGGVATDWANPAAQWIRRADLLYFVGGLACIFGFGAIALLFATTIRNAGPALGMFFLYSFFIERTIPPLINQMHRGWGPVVGRYLPASLFVSLASPRQWYVEMRRPGGVFLETEVIFLLAALYITLLVTGAYLFFRKRDL